MDCGDGGLVEEVFLDPGDGEVVPEVLLHILTVDPFQMATGHDAGGQGLGGAEGELVDEVGLTCEDDGQVGLGVSLKLGEGVQFLEDIQADEGSLVDDEGHLHFLAEDKFLDLFSDGLGEDGAGGAC